MERDWQNRLDRALELHRAGQLDVARNLYMRLTVEAPKQSEAWHLLGLLEHQCGQALLALDHLATAISLDATQSVYTNNYGAILLSLGRAAEAEASFRRAISMRQDYADAHANLGRALLQMLQPTAAAEALLHAIAIAPNRASDLRRIAAPLLHDLGDLPAAIAQYRELLNAAPDDAAVCNDLANSHLAKDETSEAIAYYERANALAPESAHVLFNLATAHARSHDVLRARVNFVRARRLAPQSAEWRLRQALVCPAVFSNRSEIEGYCRELEATLIEMGPELKGVSAERLFSAGIQPPMALAFQGHEHRALKEILASVVRPAFRPRERIKHVGKPRVGFVVTRDHMGLFLRCCAGLVELIDSRLVDVVVLGCLASAAEFRRSFANSKVRFVPIPESLSGAAQTIAAEGCDVLYHWEVGTDSLNYLLPFCNLAAVQCTGWGTQATSGVAEVDCYLSSGLIETPDAEQYFSERLWRLKSLSTYQRRMSAPGQANRDEFGIDASAHLYLCPQNLLKLHPDQDRLFAEILERDAQAVIVLKEGRSVIVGQQLRQRFATTLGQATDRIRFVPWLTHTAYLRLVSVADVILDPVHYSAGSSAYDMFSLHAPIIALPGELNLSRYTQACYRKMDFCELIAADEREYVEMAIRVGCDAEYREHVRRILVERSSVLFDDHLAADEFQQVLLELAHQARTL